MSKHDRSKHDRQVSLFSLEGRFLGFVVEDGYKLKWLRLLTAEGEHCIKLSKESRATVGSVLLPGDWIQVWGEKTLKLKTQEVKLKAYKITRRSPAASIPPDQSIWETPASQPAVSSSPAAPKAKETILVCQKSDCMKRGGKAVCAALVETLRDRGLEDQVTIRGTGCMKHCKAGPNVVFTSDKTRYSRITAAEVPELVDKHFPCPVQTSSEKKRDASSSVPAITK